MANLVELLQKLEDVRAGAGSGFGPLNTRKTRPNNTTNYIANDAINESASAGTNWTFAGAGRIAGGSGFILKAHVETSMAACVARLEVDLYTSNPTAINDHAEATRLVANSGSFLGTITFPALAKKTNASTVAEADVDVRIPFTCGDTANLFGIVRTLDAITSPVANSTWDINLGGIRD